MFDVDRAFAHDRMKKSKIAVKSQMTTEYIGHRGKVAAPHLYVG